MYPIRGLASLITAVKSSVQFSHNLTYWQNGKQQKMKLLNTWKRLVLKWIT